MIKISPVIILLLVVNLYSQQNTLEISFKNIAEYKSNWELNLSFKATTAIERGILVVFPEGLKVVPINVRINSESIWFKYSNQPPQSDSVLTWHTTDKGLIILFGQDLLSEGDLVQMSSISTLLKIQLTTDEVIQIRPVIQDTDPIIISDQIFATGNIPDTINK